MLMGASVVSYDGQPVGMVIEGNEQALHVLLPDGQDRWLRTSAVLDQSGGEVTLICYASGIGRWLAE